ncbi:Neutral ceramidase OS=Tsukamurella paurometabola (strain ATCC 8368 / DSM / CCUG 35730 / CIP 100753 / JCM 10117 / KCTC 9821 / NBRC 16120 / NCIMB 702349 /NCTC 13040) OX=521096 GN=Tpau_2570 PE=3 SV=1 [Tsukamurella paurometabola]|uniref:Neutral ceramidase n=1 Tax=Tsukamurella paurometabola (strain ATCC 8368 / DSM 20162 / CCUG 35730 / CIP 100753 / JCM 10117 / KCTC 9821 / NBRC 16120 / NCIMB 702349 / NCTC 13040) TaxID=521096 RepID=D5URW8_TSUPD|nr:neutral/alkaline non-lysosomal ceramidase N-terminal domain-containing protein [Tsukamurella paurometabola]ADG79173.1 Ceramidase [Tsukamurella paurometabola DSM 20162]SUP34391.1 Neutral ceramidase precursor [Tsukamurella paurometabola]
MSENGYHAGWAKVDVTGEPWGVGMMGYGMPGQRSRGLLTRQWARAFVLAAPGPGGEDRRIAYVVADIGMFFQAAVDEISDRLAAATEGRFTAANTVLTATHTHCGPGGHGRHLLYNVTTLGQHRRTFDRLVDGVVRAVLDAESVLAPTSLAIARGQLHDASVNRSPTSFDRNPERHRLPGRIDPAVTLLRFERDGVLAAAVDWFAVHCTSMTNTNRLISSDNKGWAAAAWERESPAPGFVAAFAQTNSGDISPNLDGAAGHGPTDDERRNTAEIGRRQLAVARDLAAAPGEPQPAVLDHRLSHIDFGACRTAHGPTGRAVLGAAFAAGTTDGIGSAAFRQGLGNPIGILSRALYRRFPALAARQAPKEMLLPVGALGWVQERLPVQLIRIGDLYLVCLPVEVTVTAGARLRTAVATELGVLASAVLIQGYANGYAHYLTTAEEYDAQRYEAGSTIFGRNQLAAFIEAAARLAADMSAGRASAPGTAPTPRRAARIGSPSGSTIFARRRPVHVVAVRTPAPSDPVLTVEFGCGHPNRVIPDSYVRVQRHAGQGWDAYADDDAPCTEISWARQGTGFRATVRVSDVGPGVYRVGYCTDRPGHYTWSGPVTVR